MVVLAILFIHLSLRADGRAWMTAAVHSLPRRSPKDDSGTMGIVDFGPLMFGWAVLVAGAVYVAPVLGRRLGVGAAMSIAAAIAVGVLAWDLLMRLATPGHVGMTTFDLIYLVPLATGATLVGASLRALRERVRTRYDAVGPGALFAFIALCGALLVLATATTFGFGG
jgi:hypothetical protein